jgi:hypothetical protein
MAWALVVGGALFGAALTQWPYRHECSFGLFGYLAAVLVLLLTAGWAAVAAWQIRSAAAHACALVIGFWGVVLAAEQILPRVGYAADQQWWRCSSIPAPAPTPPVLPAVQAVPDSAALADSTGTDTTVSDTSSGGASDTAGS